MIAFGVSLSIFLLQITATAAFVPPSTKCSVGNSQSLHPAHCDDHQKDLFLRRKFLTRRFAGLDDEGEDDDDDEFDDKGPLANGIDSVSWLPSVDGAKGDNMPIDTPEDVRHVTSKSSYADGK